MTGSWLAETNALEIFVFVTALLQLWAAFLLAWPNGWRNPLRGVSSLLLVLNGMVSFAVLLSSWGALSWLGDGRPRALEKLFDLPTNFILPFVAWSLLLPWDAGWPRRMRLAFLLVVPIAAAIGLGFFITGTSGLVQPWEFLLQQTPVYASYSAILWIVTWRFLGSTSESSTWTLVLVAYGARAAQFGFYTGFPYAFGHTWADIGVFTIPNGLTHVLLLASSVGCVGWVAWRMAAGPRRGPSLMVWTILALAAAGGVGLILRQAGDSTLYTALQLVTLVAIRPVLLGWALERERTLEMLGVLGIWSAVALFFKALVDQSVGVSFWEVSVWDLLALAFALAFLPVAFGTASAFRRILDRFGSPPSKAAAESPAEKANSRNPTKAERVIGALLDKYRLSPELWVPSHELAALARVADGNLGRDVENARQALSDRANGHQPKELLEIRISHRGPQVREYRLTEAGAKAARHLQRASDQPGAVLQSGSRLSKVQDGKRNT